MKQLGRLLLAVLVICCLTPVVMAECEHEFSDWRGCCPATCYVAGMERRVCALCGAVEEREIPQKDHCFKGVVIVEPTESSAGIIEYTCERCGYVHQKPVYAEGTVYSGGEKQTAAVRKIQKMLAEMGLYDGENTGRYGEKTQKAVAEFQRLYGIEDSGIAYVTTIEKMEKAYEAQLSGNPLPTVDLTAIEEAKDCPYCTENERCYKHEQLYQLAKVSEAEDAYGMWQDEWNNLFSTLMGLKTDTDRTEVQSWYEYHVRYNGSRHAILYSKFGGDTEVVLRKMTDLLERQSRKLCEDIGAAQ